jgi:F-type H+-transporting ATPase subunit b
MVVYHAVNLAILLFLLVKFAGKNVVSALRNRSERVSADIKEAARLHEEANEMLEQYKTQLAGFEAEATALLDDYRAMGETERQRIIDEATQEAERIVQEAKRVANNEAVRAKEKLESEIVDRAIVDAEAIILKQLTDADHGRLVTDYFGQLDASVRSGQ